MKDVKTQTSKTPRTTTGKKGTSVKISSKQETASKGKVKTSVHDNENVRLTSDEASALMESIMSEVEIDGDETVGQFLLLFSALAHEEDAQVRHDIFYVLKYQLLPHTIAITDVLDKLVSKAYRKVRIER